VAGLDELGRAGVAVTLVVELASDRDFSAEHAPVANNVIAINAISTSRILIPPRSLPITLLILVSDLPAAGRSLA
jgi:hypothetical protein